MSPVRSWTVRNCIITLLPLNLKGNDNNRLKYCRAHIEAMLNEILEIDNYEMLVDNYSVMKCSLCEHTAVTIGAMNHHIGTQHLGKTALLTRKEERVDKK